MSGVLLYCGSLMFSCRGLFYVFLHCFWLGVAGLSASSGLFSVVRFVVAVCFVSSDFLSCLGVVVDLFIVS